MTLGWDSRKDNVKKIREKRVKVEQKSMYVCTIDHDGKFTLYKLDGREAPDVVMSPKSKKVYVRKGGSMSLLTDMEQKAKAITNAHFIERIYFYQQALSVRTLHARTKIGETY